jgi:hypothetical protein
MCPPAIYVGSLLDLNNGITHGQWIDATIPAGSMLTVIAAMLDRSPTTARTGEPAAEWLILDSEGFDHRIDAHETLGEVQRLAVMADTAGGAG